jgi:hypothetical protein
MTKLSRESFFGIFIFFIFLVFIIFIKIYDDRLGYIVREKVILLDKNSTFDYKNIDIKDLNGVKIIYESPVVVTKNCHEDVKYLRDFTPVFYGMVVIIVAIITLSANIFKRDNVYEQ